MAREDLFTLLDARWRELNSDAVVVLIQDHDGLGSLLRIDLHSKVDGANPKHAESYKQKVGRHIKHVYLVESEIPTRASSGSIETDAGLEVIFDRLKAASKLFDDMHAGRPNEKHHEAVDKHSLLTNEVVRGLGPGWTLVFGRPI